MVGVLMLSLSDAGHRFEPVTLAGLTSHNILDHPEVYPGIAASGRASARWPHC